MSKLQDVKAILHLFAGIMAQPERVTQKEFKLESNDFPEPFHQIVFGAMYNLQLQGVEKITPVDVDGYLSEYSAQYLTFSKNNGLDYLFKLEEIGEPDNFQYYYNRVKKFSLLRSCNSMGLDIAEIYDAKVVDLKDEKEQNDRFNEITLQEIVRHIEGKIVNIRDQFLSDSVLNGGHISDNIDDIVEENMKSPNYGAPTISLYLNSILKGSKKRKFITKHAGTGTGKSRMGMANLAVKCIPERWCSKTNKWIKTGANGRGLFITTELDEEEVKIPFICYIADVEEDIFKDRLMTEEQTARFFKAKEILKESTLWFEELSDFDISDIESTIVKYVNKHEVEYCEFDYIHTSLKLLTSLANAGVKNLREDQVILIMGIALKNLCNKYDIHIESSTQLNDNQNANNNMDQSWIRGSKALADKIDGGYIMLPIREKDEKIIEAVYSSGAITSFGIMPNMTLNIFKNRGGRYKNIRIFGHFNGGTLKFQDLFLTNYKGELLTNIEKREIIMSSIDEEDELPASFNF